TTVQPDGETEIVPVHPTDAPAPVPSGGEGASGVHIFQCSVDDPGISDIGVGFDTGIIIPEGCFFSVYVHNTVAFDDDNHGGNVRLLLTSGIDGSSFSVATEVDNLDTYADSGAQVEKVRNIKTADIAGPFYAESAFHLIAYILAGNSPPVGAVTGAATVLVKIDADA